MLDQTERSLSDLENGILRGNRKPVVFGKNDPRRAYVLQTFDPRVHFLLLNRHKFFNLHQSMILYEAKSVTMYMQVCDFDDSTTLFIRRPQKRFAMATK